ncbi:MAG: glutathione S-transferase family protein [Pseudomonadota bacterium]
MKLFHSARTRSSRIVWLLEEAGIDYELVPIRLGAADQPAAFLAASPMRKVPAIEDGDVALADSAAIAMYIADRYPEASLAPAIDDPLRGSYLFWCMFTPGVMEPALSEKLAGSEPNPRSNGWGNFELMLSTLEAALAEGPWLLGEQFSAADILTGSGVVYMRRINVLPASGVLEDYAERCLARPGLRLALSMDEPGAD